MIKNLFFLLLVLLGSCGFQIKQSEAIVSSPSGNSVINTDLTFDIQGLPQTFDLKIILGESENVIEINGEKIILMKNKEMVFSQGTIIIENNKLTVKPTVGTEGVIEIHYVAGDKQGKILFNVKSKTSLCSCSGVIKKRIASFGLLTQYGSGPAFGIDKLGIINIGLDSHYTNKNFKVEWGDGVIDYISDSVDPFVGVTWYRDDYHLLSISAPHIYPGAGDYVLKVSALSDEGLYSEASTIVRIDSLGDEVYIPETGSHHAPFFPFPATKHPTSIDTTVCDQPILNGYSVGLANQHWLKINDGGFLNGEMMGASGDVYKFSNVPMPHYLGIQSLYLKTSYAGSVVQSQSDYLLYCE